MGNALKSLLIILFVIVGTVCSAQTSVQVSDPVIELKGNTIHISYDILNSTQSQEFEVELRVRDDQGNTIYPKALKGDVGETVNGGENKQIEWDLEADRIEINADIFIKVYVKAIPPPEPVAVIPPIEDDEEGADSQFAEEPEENPDEILEDKQSRESINGKQYNRAGLILQSVAFPGWGLSKYKGGPHWIKGVAGYGCLAGSVILNKAAVRTYDGIMDEVGYDAKNDLYQKALKQDQISEVLTYTAIAIWVSDLVWTIAGTSDIKTTGLQRTKLNISPTIDPISSAPLLSFTYQF